MAAAPSLDCSSPLLFSSARYGVLLGNCAEIARLQTLAMFSLNVPASWNFNAGLRALLCCAPSLRNATGIMVVSAIVAWVFCTPALVLYVHLLNSRFRVGVRNFAVHQPPHLFLTIASVNRRRLS